MARRKHGSSPKRRGLTPWGKSFDWQMAEPKLSSPTDPRKESSKLPVTWRIECAKTKLQKGCKSRRIHVWYIYLHLVVRVGKYTMHGSYGNWQKNQCHSAIFPVAILQKIRFEDRCERGTRFRPILRRYDWKTMLGCPYRTEFGSKWVAILLIGLQVP